MRGRVNDRRNMDSGHMTLMVCMKDGTNHCIYRSTDHISGRSVGHSRYLGMTAFDSFYFEFILFLLDSKP